MLMIHIKNDGILDIDNMPLGEEAESIINELNLYSKKNNQSTPLTILSYSGQSYDSLELYI